MICRVQTKEMEQLHTLAEQEVQSQESHSKIIPEPRDL